MQLRNGQDQAPNLLDTPRCISDPSVLRSSVPPRATRAEKSTTNELCFGRRTTENKGDGYRKEQQIKSKGVAHADHQESPHWAVRKGVRKGARKLVQLNWEGIYCCIKIY